MHRQQVLPQILQMDTYNHLLSKILIWHYNFIFEALYTVRPKPTPVAKPSHADAAATNANTGNIVSLLSYYELYNYSFNTKFLLIFINNLTFYNNTNILHSQYKPIIENLFIKITRTHPTITLIRISLIGYIMII